MEKILNNRILRNTLLGVFLLAVFLAPVSFRADTSGTVVLSLNESFAQAEEQSIWTFFSNPGQAVGNIVLSAASFFTWMGGLFLDSALDYTVFGMGDSVNTSGLRDTINALWTLIRDICNLAFIFGFIFIGIRTIIDPDSASTKRFLSHIIIGALLINFSLFFAKAVIDFSNFTAYQVYNSMTIVPAAKKVSLSEAITQKLGIITLYNAGDGKVLKTIAENKSFSFFAGASLFLLITAFVFFAGAILLIVRFVTLILIMVASPILFAAIVFPQTESFAKDLWKKLISQSFFAPAYLLLVLISIQMVEGLGIQGKNFAAELSGAANNNFSAALNFIIIIFFMISSLTIASKMGVKGGDMAVKFAGGMSFGLAARMGRATAGRWGHNLSQNETLLEKQGEKSFRGFLARTALKGSRAVGDTSFDLRNVNKDLSKSMNIGEGRKGGYKTVKEEIEKKESEHAKSLGVLDDSDVRVQARKKEMEMEERKQRDLEEELRGIQNDGSAANILKRKNKRQEIEDAKKKIEDAKKKYELEKQRRVTGSTYSEPEDDHDRTIKNTFELDIKKKKEDMKTLWGGGRLHSGGLVGLPYAGLSVTDKSYRREEIEQHKKELEELEEGLFEHLTRTQRDRGHAGVLDASKLLSYRIPTWMTGRLVKHSTEAGKALRKSVGKGLPKEKD